MMDSKLKKYLASKYSGDIAVDYELNLYDIITINDDYIEVRDARNHLYLVFKYTIYSTKDLEIYLISSENGKIIRNSNGGPVKIPFS